MTPWYLRADWALFNVANSSSVTVSIAYWTLVYDGKTINQTVYLSTLEMNTQFLGKSGNVLYFTEHV